MQTPRESLVHRLKECARASVPLLTALCLVMQTSAFAGSAVIHVDQTATGGNDGTSWQDAYTDLQAALSAASVGDEIWVAKGVYRPTSGTDREASFQLKSQVSIYGGFSGDETVREARSWPGNPTILSGDIDGDESLDGNSYHVVSSSGTDSTTLLDGFTVTGGNADGSSALNNRGGGIYNRDGNPTLQNLRIVRNYAVIGGGMFNISNEILSGNPALINVSFLGNLAADGGGMSISGGAPSLTNVAFSGNFAGFRGGGMDILGGSTPQIRNTVIWNNRDVTGVGTLTSSIHNTNTTAIPSIRNSLVQGCNPGGNWNSDCGSDAGNNLFDADPRFVHTPQPSNVVDAVGNLKLLADSPAIDAGNNLLINIPADLSGNQRIVNGTVDLGPYERPAGDCPVGGVLFVGAGGTEPGDGSSWTRAFNDLQDALAVNEACEIWVARGLYKPAADPVREATFRLRDGLGVYGGFFGGETVLAQRDWQANPTVLSGDLDGNDSQTDEFGVVPLGVLVRGDNAHHVVTTSGTNETTVLDGFFVTAGSADAPAPDDAGGGIRNLGGRLTLANLSVTGNRGFNGAGMLNRNASPSMSSIRFAGNRAGNRGGGLLNWDDSDPVLMGVVFQENTAAGFGGGLANLINSDPILVNVAFIGNQALFGGGMTTESNSNPDVSNAIFLGNYAGEFGGGLSNNVNSSPALTGVTFSGNYANQQGGGIDNFDGSNPEIVNSIFWNNRDGTGTTSATSSVVNDGSSPSFSYSLVQGCGAGLTWGGQCGTDGGSNLQPVDPLFLDTPQPLFPGPITSGDLRVCDASPVINQGNNAAVAVATDFDGNDRIIGGVVDLGAYEFAPDPDLLFRSSFESEFFCVPSV